MVAALPSVFCVGLVHLAVTLPWAALAIIVKVRVCVTGKVIVPPAQSRTPDQPPEATQLVAPVALQVTVTLPPPRMVSGVDVTVHVGTCCAASCAARKHHTERGESQSLNHGGNSSPGVSMMRGY